MSMLSVFSWWCLSCAKYIYQKFFFLCILLWNLYQVYPEKSFFLHVPMPFTFFIICTWNFISWLYISINVKQKSVNQEYSSSVSPKSFTEWVCRWKLGQNGDWPAWSVPSAICFIRVWDSNGSLSSTYVQSAPNQDSNTYLHLLYQLQPSVEGTSLLS